MMRLVVVVLLMAACAVPELETAETTQAGTSAQGTSAQGTSAQGTSAQGTSAQGTSAQGTTSGGVAVSDARVIGTALQFWKLRSDGYWLQYLPNRICVWAPSRWFEVSCTSYNLATQASPLAGSRWPMEFVRDNGDGTTTHYHMQVQIGLSATHVGAVMMDTSQAMFDLRSSGATGAVVSCDNPAGCRRNTDLFLYDVRVVDFDGSLGSLCPSGERAFALAGTWDGSANAHASSTEFTFACTNGTIAKCVRWGYRPWASALRNHDPDTATPTALAGYHQACVHAAMADYCGTAHSFTKNGTVIDISDDDFIPSTRNLVGHYTAAVREGSFDQKGGYWLDQSRYDELQMTSPDFNIETVCPDTFITGTFIDTYARPGVPTYPLLEVESTPSCAHTEFQLGKWLHKNCSACTTQVQSVLPYCSDPSAPRGWDADCVAAARSCDSTTKMSPSHGECTTGRGLNSHDSGCTLVLSLKGYTSCFVETNPAAWTSTCVSAANAYCTGGQEHSAILGAYGFCNERLSTTTAP